jgi:hypothetical protein
LAGRHGLELQPREIICFYKLIYFLYSEGPEKIAILISFAALRTSVTHAVDVKNLQENVSFRGRKLCQIKAVAAENLEYCVTV